jgi:acetyl esterase
MATRRSQPRAVVALLARDAGSPKLRTTRGIPGRRYHLVGASYDKYANGCGLLTKAAMVWFRDHYSGAGDADDWRASPIKAASFAGLPRPLSLLRMRRLTR